jgi:hypothetical protein
MLYRWASCLKGSCDLPSCAVRKELIKPTRCFLHCDEYRVSRARVIKTTIWFSFSDKVLSFRNFSFAQFALSGIYRFFRHWEECSLLVCYNLRCEHHKVQAKQPRDIISLTKLLGLFYTLFCSFLIFWIFSMLLFIKCSLAMKYDEK